MNQSQLTCSVGAHSLTSRQRLLLLNALDITVHGAAQGRVLLELQNLPGAECQHGLLCLQLPTGAPLLHGIEQMPGWLRKVGFRAGLALWLFPHLLKRLRKVDAVVFYGVDLQIMILTLLAAQITRTPVFNEITEHPQILFAASRYKQVGTYIYEHLLLRRLSGLIVISSALQRYCSELAPTMPVHVMPPIAEPTVSQQPVGVQPGLFTYAGSLSEPKDGVISLVRAFATVHGQHPEARLRIFGHGSDSQRAALEAEVTSLGLSDVVEVSAPIARGPLLQAMRGSDVLVHCRPNSQQAEFGFPTKLAEYLSCGRPVVTTITSDIARFLHDRESAFLVEPDDPQAFAQAMLATLEDRVLADAVGAHGREVFDQHFRAGPAVARLGTWISEQLWQRTSTP